MNYAAIGAQTAPGNGAPIPLAFPWTAVAVLSLSQGLVPGVAVHSKPRHWLGLQQGRTWLPQPQFGDSVPIVCEDSPRSWDVQAAGITTVRLEKTFKIKSNNDVIASHPDSRIPRIPEQSSHFHPTIAAGAQGCSVCAESSGRATQGFSGCLCQPGTGGNRAPFSSASSQGAQLCQEQAQPCVRSIRAAPFYCNQ